MPMLDPFKGDGFSVIELTKAINIVPNNYGRVRQSGLFRPKGVRVRTVAIEEHNGVLNLLQTQPPGSPGTTDRRGSRKLRSFKVPHIPHDAELLPEEYEGIRGFGDESDMDAVADVVNDKLARMRAKHAITQEHLMMGALKGVILDADASTLFDLYSEFEVSQKVVDFVLGTSTTDVEKKCREVVRHIEAKLKGEVMSGVRAYVSPEFFDKLVAHAKVRESYINWSAAERLRDGQADGQDATQAFIRRFPFGGVVFEEYPGEATDAAGNARKFIAAQEGHAYPAGTMDTFEILYSPADFVETVNTRGIELYAKMEPRKFNRGMDIHTQSNPLPICYRPEVLVKVHTSN